MHYMTSKINCLLTLESLMIFDRSPKFVVAVGQHDCYGHIHIHKITVESMGAL